MSYGKNEFIKLNRSFLTWDRYKNVNVKVVFIHCLLKANWKDGSWKGVPVKRGQFISSVSKIAEECGLTYSKVRTALEHLISDENIETNVLDFSQEQSRKHLQGKPTIFTVVGYDKYQAVSENIETNSQEYSENNLRSLTTIEEIKNRERSKEVKNNNKPPLSPLGEMVEKTDYTKTLKDKLHDWLKYKSEKKQSYKPTGFKTLLKKIDDVVKSSGEQTVIDAIDASMSNNWQGLFFDKFIIDTTSVPKQQTFNMDEFLKRYDE